jgi:hypothetical protein
MDEILKKTGAQIDSILPAESVFDLNYRTMI